VRDVLDPVMRWYAAGRPAALATVVRTWRSAPRPAGAALAVSGTGEVVGSVSGGCVEGAVYELAQEVLADGRPRLVTYGVSDDDAFAVGLTCGGILDVFVARVDADRFPQLPELAEAIRGEEPVALATVVAGPGRLGARMLVRPHGHTGSLGSTRLDDAVAADARGRVAAGTTGTLHLGADGERRRDELTVLVEAFGPRPRMYVFGAIDFAAAVVRIGRFLGYHVTVCDARPVFATPARFPDADAVVVEWPHRWLATAPVDDRTVICVLTHDPKFDVPLLTTALRRPAAYVGAMGSRRTHAARLAALRDEGVTDAELARLAAPIGLDLGGRTPEETAVSIAAEIVAARWGGSGRRLSELSGAIHSRDEAADGRPAGRAPSPAPSHR
jgi:xanthine dehydrogenase accessory factor